MQKVVSVREQERRKDPRRQVRLNARLDGWPAEIVDISLSGVGLLFQSKQIVQQGEDVFFTEPLSGFGRLAMDIGNVAGLEIFVSQRIKFQMKLVITRKNFSKYNIGGRFKSIEQDYPVIEGLMTGRILRSAKG